ncbi:tryptophan synthase beta subunit-like PLP-dependent enzyme [Dactylonectria estremocensis]|uniref:Tryptophan synthase beta subunit-like PLP-dependent enzyme n=1 Tax=Dactylonectria estremocensis TaxID=1079267 RepID=A0A9P9EKN3_9HYPO|nr:tryptophan synthase beta subunit-like PLP-dependent enzyme [Dactylonectria estremocensis]
MSETLLFDVAPLLPSCLTTLSSISSDPPGSFANVFLKLEYFNPIGSYKDRMTKSIEETEKRGGLKAGITMVEARSGGTGSSLALICAAKGLSLPTMRAFSTQVDIIQSPSGKIHADLIPSIIRRVAEHLKDPQMYWTDQSNNRDAFVEYQLLGSELTDQFPNGTDAFCGAFGTAGMVMGVADSWNRHIEGIGISIVPPLLNKDLVICRRLAKEESLLVGTSMGLNVVGALGLAKELSSGKTVATVACNTGLKDIMAICSPRLEIPAMDRRRVM